MFFALFHFGRTALLFRTSSPMGALNANVATAVVKQLSNLKIDVLLENRDALSRKAREEVSPTFTPRPTNRRCNALVRRRPCVPKWWAVR